MSKVLKHVNHQTNPPEKNTPFYIPKVTDPPTKKQTELLQLSALKTSLDKERLRQAADALFYPSRPLSRLEAEQWKSFVIEPDPGSHLSSTSHEYALNPPADNSTYELQMQMDKPHQNDPLGLNVVDYKNSLIRDESQLTNATQTEDAFTMLHPLETDPIRRGFATHLQNFSMYRPTMSARWNAPAIHDMENLKKTDTKEQVNTIKEHDSVMGKLNDKIIEVSTEIETLTNQARRLAEQRPPGGSKRVENEIKKVGRKILELRTQLTALQNTRASGVYTAYKEGYNKLGTAGIDFQTSKRVRGQITTNEDQMPKPPEPLDPLEQAKIPAFVPPRDFVRPKPKPPTPASSQVGSEEDDDSDQSEDDDGGQPEGDDGDQPEGDDGGQPEGGPAGGVYPEEDDIIAKALEAQQDNPLAADFNNIAPEERKTAKLDRIARTNKWFRQYRESREKDRNYTQSEIGQQVLALVLNEQRDLSDDQVLTDYFDSVELSARTFAIFKDSRSNPTTLNSSAATVPVAVPTLPQEDGKKTPEKKSPEKKSGPRITKVSGPDPPNKKQKEREVKEREVEEEWTKEEEEESRKNILADLGAEDNSKRQKNAKQRLTSTALAIAPLFSTLWSSEGEEKSAPLGKLQSSLKKRLSQQLVEIMKNPKDAEEETLIKEISQNFGSAGVNTTKSAQAAKKNFKSESIEDNLTGPIAPLVRASLLEAFRSSLPSTAKGTVTNLIKSMPLKDVEKKFSEFMVGKFTGQDMNKIIEELANPNLSAKFIADGLEFIKDQISRKETLEKKTEKEKEEKSGDQDAANESDLSFTLPETLTEIMDSDVPWHRVSNSERKKKEVYPETKQVKDDLLEAIEKMEPPTQSAYRRWKTHIDGKTDEEKRVILTKLRLDLQELKASINSTKKEKSTKGNSREQTRAYQGMLNAFEAKYGRQLDLIKFVIMDLEPEMQVVQFERRWNEDKKNAHINALLESEMQNFDNIWASSQTVGGKSKKDKILENLTLADKKINTAIIKYKDLNQSLDKIIEWKKIMADISASDISALPRDVLTLDNLYLANSKYSRSKLAPKLVPTNSTGAVFVEKAPGGLLFSKPQGGPALTRGLQPMQGSSRDLAALLSNPEKHQRVTRAEIPKNATSLSNLLTPAKPKKTSLEVLDVVDLTAPDVNKPISPIPQIAKPAEEVVIGIGDFGEIDFEVGDFDSFVRTNRMYSLKMKEQEDAAKETARLNKLAEDQKKAMVDSKKQFDERQEQLRLAAEQQQKAVAEAKKMTNVPEEEMGIDELVEKKYLQMQEEKKRKQKEAEEAVIQNAHKALEEIKKWEANQANLQAEERQKREKQLAELSAARLLEIEEREKQQEKERQERRSEHDEKTREFEEKIREQKEKAEQHTEERLGIQTQIDELKAQMEGKREMKTEWNDKTGRFETKFAEKPQPTRMVTRSSSRERTLSNLPGTDLENTVLGNQASTLRRRMSTTSIPDQIPPRTGIRNQAHDKRNYLKPNSIEEMRQKLKTIKPIVTIEPGTWIDETFEDPAIPGWTKLSSFDPFSKAEALQYLFYRANTEADQSSEIFKNLMAVLRKSGKIRVAPIVPGPSSRRASLQGSSPSLAQPPPEPSPRRDSHLGLGINRQVGQGLGHQNDYNLSHLSRKRPITDLYDYEDCYHHVSDGFSLAPHLSKYSRHF